MRRPPIDIRRSRPGGQARSRIWLAVVAGALLVLLFSLRGIATFYTDVLWFREVGYSVVFRNRLATAVALTGIFTLAFFLLVWVNLMLADRLAPTFRPAGPEDEVVARYQEFVAPRRGLVRVGLAAALALLGGTGAGSHWEEWLLFRNSVPFGGGGDPLFGRDISFYVFRLPFLSFTVDWLFVALTLTLIVTAAAHYLNGGIRLQAAVERVTPQVKAHLSVLLALLALVKGADYWISRFELNFSDRGFVRGAGYTDVNAHLPALQLLLLITLAASVLFVVNIWRRGWALPVIAVLVWGVVAVVAGAIYPALYQRIRVKPQENQRERPYIARNIEATRNAMGIGDVREEPFDYTGNLTAEALAANSGTIRNVRLWDPDTLQSTYEALQEIRRYYKFDDVDIDRYQIGDETRQVVLSVRSLNTGDIPGESWVNQHLQYTHGYGAVLSSANAVDAQGRPDFLLRGIPPTGQPEITEPRVYFSEDLPGFAIGNTRQPEIDFQAPGGQDRSSNYRGEGGVPLSSAARRFAFFLRFGDPNLLLSSDIRENSRLIFNRDIRTRIRKVAPFLALDSDPYPVIADGRIVWIQDAYTLTSHYPYGQPADGDGLRAGADLGRGGFNYVRNSVKITVDAYSGRTTLYIWDDEDPIVRAYAKVFPGLFTPGSEMPEELRRHVRYPEDLFRVQANMFGQYHVTEPDAFFRGADAWNIAQDPGTGDASQSLARPVAPAQAPGAPGLAPRPRRQPRMDPTYLLLRLPGEDDLNFTILQPFVPASENDQQINLTAFLTADSDPDSYGAMRAFVMPRGQQIDGPLTVNNAIQAEPTIANEITLLDQRGSKVLFGQVQVIPIENSLLYVRPLYVTSERTTLPEVKRVIVVYDGKAVMRTSLQESLAALFGSAPPTLEERQPGDQPGAEPPPAGGALDPAVQALLAQALAARDEALAALRAGDLATYQRKIDEAFALVEQARRRGQNGGGGGQGTTTTTSASASA